MNNEQKTALCAEAGHEMNRLYCRFLGDLSQPSWEAAPDWQKASAIQGVEGAMSGATPEQSHETWMAQKVADGWTFGEAKDSVVKTHPCMVPYGDLPEDQRLKDFLYLTTVRAMSSAVGLAEEA